MLLTSQYPHIVITGVAPWGTLSLLHYMSLCMLNGNGVTQAMRGPSARLPLEQFYFVMSISRCSRLRPCTRVSRPRCPGPLGQITFTARISFGVLSIYSRGVLLHLSNALFYGSVVALDTTVQGLTNFTEIMKAEQERYLTGFMSMYERLLNKQSISCAVTKTEFPSVKAPKMVVLDVSVISIFVL